MAVLEIYRKKHWADDDSFALFKMSTEAYNRRYQRGDIIRLREDAECPEPPSLTGNVVHLRITRNDGSELPKATLIELVRRYVDAEGVPIRKARYSIDWERLPTVVFNAFRDTGTFTATVAQVKANLDLLEKETEMQPDIETLIAN